MAKDLIWDPILACLAQIWSPKIFCGRYLYYMLEIVASYHCMLFQEKLMNQTWKNGKKLILGLILACSCPNLVTKNIFEGFTSTRCYALLQAIIVCNFKEN